VPRTFCYYCCCYLTLQCSCTRIETRALQSNEILSATALDYRSSEFDNGFLAPPCRTHAGGVGNKNYLYTLYTHTTHVHTCVCVCVCACMRVCRVRMRAHDIPADRFKCGSRRVALPSAAAVTAAVPIVALYRLPLHYFNIYRLSSLQSEIRRIPPPPRAPHTAPINGDARRKFDRNMICT